MNLFFRKGKWVLRKGKIPGPNCKDECCSGDGGGPGPGDDCNDTPTNCFYELLKCRGVRDGKRYFVTVAEYQAAIDREALPPGSCLWYNCRFLPWPTSQPKLKRADVQTIINSGVGVDIFAFHVGAGDQTINGCCKNGCGDGCQEQPLYEHPADGPDRLVVGCCCNFAGSCVTTEWSFRLHRRSTRLTDPNDWSDVTIAGSGTERACYETGWGGVPPNVHVHTDVGPTWSGGAPIPDFDLPATPNPIFGPGGSSYSYGGCLLAIGHYSAVGTIGSLQDQPFPVPTVTCKTLRWSVIQSEDRVEGDYRIVSELTAFSNETLSEGTSDCGGGCFDTTSPIPLGARPLWVKALSMLAKPEDTGLGDTITRVVGIFGGEVFKSWFKKTTGRDCGCDSRAAAFNAKYPFVK